MYERSLKNRHRNVSCKVWRHILQILLFRKTSFSRVVSTGKFPFEKNLQESRLQHICNQLSAKKIRSFSENFPSPGTVPSRGTFSHFIFSLKYLRRIGFNIFPTILWQKTLKFWIFRKFSKSRKCPL